MGFSDRKIVYGLICLGNITISFNIAAITAVIPTISLDLGLPDFQIAKIIPYYLIPYGIGALLYAPFTHKFSYRRILGISLTLFALSSFFCGFVSSLHPFLFWRIGMGVTAASAIPLGLMIIGDIFPKEVRGRLVGGFFSCSFFASFAGIVSSGMIHWRWLFFIPALLAFSTAMSFWILKSKLLEKVHGAQVNYLKAFRNINIRNVFIFIFFISLLYHGVHKWYGVYLSRIYGLDKLSISYFFILMALGGAIGQMAGGYLSDKKGRLMSCRIGIGGLAVSVMALAGHYPLGFLGVILFLTSMFWTIGHNGISTVLTDFPERERPVIASLNSSVRFISGGIGFGISAVFVQQSFGLTFLNIGILIVLLSIILKRLLPENP